MNRAILTACVVAPLAWATYELRRMYRQADKTREQFEGAEEPGDG